MRREDSQIAVWSQVHLEPSCFNHLINHFTTDLVTMLANFSLSLNTPTLSARQTRLQTIKEDLQAISSLDAEYYSLFILCNLSFQVGGDARRIRRGFAAEYASRTCRVDSSTWIICGERKGRKRKSLRFAATNLAMSHRVTPCGCTQEVNEFVDSSCR